MASRDDIVISPRISREDRPTAPVRAREERRLSGAKKKAGLLRRLGRAQAARLLVQGRRRAPRFRATGGSAVRFGAAGLLVAGVAIAGATIARITSGRSFENMGEALNHLLLGHLDEEARAKMETRQRFMADDDLMRTVAQTGVDNQQVRELFQEAADIRRKQLEGEAKLRQNTGLQVNNIADILIERFAEKFVQMWRGGGGDDAVRDLRKNWQARLDDGRAVKSR